MSAPKVDASYVRGVEEARTHLKEVLKETHAEPLFLRLAVHDAFAYDSNKKIFGANASVRTQKELGHKGNEGLNQAVELLATIKAKVSNISYADLYQLAGAVALESVGGPKIAFTPGRRDAWTFPPQSAYLSPNTSDKPLEAYMQWIQRTGLSQKDAVALLGLHAIARWWPDKENQYTLPYLPHDATESPRLSNVYFRMIVAGQLPQDQWLLEDTGVGEQIHAYAEDEEAFRKDLVASFENLSRLGTNLTASPLGSLSEAASIQSLSYTQLSTSAQLAVGAAAAVVVGGLVAYGIWRRRRRGVRV